MAFLAHTRFDVTVRRKWIVGGQKEHADRVVTGPGQLHRLRRRGAQEEAMRHRHEQTCAVARAGIAALRTAMGERFEHRKAIRDNRARRRA